MINIKLKQILLYTLASVYFANFSSMLLGMCSGCAILKLTEANCCEKGIFLQLCPTSGTIIRLILNSIFSGLIFGICILC